MRDLKGNLLSDKMVGHIFQVEDGLVKRFDIRGSGENQGQSTRDLGGYSRRPTPARSFPDTDRTVRRTLHQSHRYDLARKRHIACCRLSGNCLKLGTLAAQKGVREFWNQSHCSLAIKVLRVY